MIKEKRKSKFIITNRKILLIIFILSAFYNGLIVKNYKIRTDKILDSHSIRIVLISDLHSHVYGKNQSKIINKIKKQNPDIIALAGDIADDMVPIEGTKLFLEGINDIAPVFYVTGNHEIWTDEVDYIKEVFKSFNIIVLENDYRKVDINGVELVMAGVDDPDIIKYERPHSNWNEEIYKSFSNIEDVSGYKVLLSHRPEAVDFYNSLPFDMVLSGHSHGGQVRIPFILNGLFAPNQGFFPKYAGGVYEQESYTHIVSRGVSFNPRLPRIFNPPEIVVIDIQGQ
ncbi:metallophosphoesterase [Tissierella carlieri]|uniref:Metallophosphoesterase n=1 Tax=Tissierella carlieri TaxID=689904 RepID=A0ABT1SA37_9FIRM|nr:metallophosphoesterase [Tissierella carlieri]MCQ4923309.1 metallophosphoesterase [Tissierella carlieri]